MDLLVNLLIPFSDILKESVFNTFNLVHIVGKFFTNT